MVSVDGEEILLLLFDIDIDVDFGCPNGHEMQCFNDSGHKDATGGEHWNEKVEDD